MGIANLGVSLERSNYVDFTHPCRRSAYSFMIGQKFAYKEQNLKLANNELYIILLLAWLFICSALTMKIAKQKLKSYRFKINPFWSQTMAMFQKGADVHEVPKKIALRLLLLIWLFTGLIIMGIISGILIWILAGNHKVPICTIDDLHRSSLKTYSFYDFTAKQMKVSKRSITSCAVNVRFFQTHSNRQIQELYNRLLPRMMNTSETTFIRDHLPHEPIALISSSMSLSCFAKTVGQHLFYLPPTSSENSISVRDYAIALPKGSTLKKPFDFAIKRLEETGVLFAWKGMSELMVTKHIIADNGEIPRVNSADLIIDCLYIFIFGAIVCVVCTIAERQCNGRNLKKLLSRRNRIQFTRTQLFTRLRNTSSF